MLLPDNEAERVAALHSFGILDTKPESQFDDLTSLSAMACKVPMAWICFIDEGRQWFKSTVGLQLQQSPRKLAMCAHAILSDSLMVVEDASDDHRFAENPFVATPSGVRFYASAPLQVAPRIRIGTLSVADTKPRQISSFEAHALRTIGESVVAQLKLLYEHQSVPRPLDGHVLTCAWCRKFHSRTGDWVTAEEYLQHRFSSTHGICPACEYDVRNTAPSPSDPTL